MLLTRDQRIRLLRILESSLEEFSTECVLLSSLIENDRIDDELSARAAIKLEYESNKIINIAKGNYEV